MDELKPCPFCGADNKLHGDIMRTANRGEWKHWFNGCILGCFVIRDIEAWRRTDGGKKQTVDSC